MLTETEWDFWVLSNEHKKLCGGQFINFASFE